MAVVAGGMEQGEEGGELRCVQTVFEGAGEGKGDVVRGNGGCGWGVAGLKGEGLEERGY